MGTPDLGVRQRLSKRIANLIIGIKVKQGEHGGTVKKKDLLY